MSIEEAPKEEKNLLNVYATVGGSLIRLFPNFLCNVLYVYCDIVCQGNFVETSLRTIILREIRFLKFKPYNIFNNNEVFGDVICMVIMNF